MSSGLPGLRMILAKDNSAFLSRFAGFPVSCMQLCFLGPARLRLIIRDACCFVACDACLLSACCFMMPRSLPSDARLPALSSPPMPLHHHAAKLLLPHLGVYSYCFSYALRRISRAVQHYQFNLASSQVGQANQDQNMLYLLLNQHHTGTVQSVGCPPRIRN